MQPRSQAEPSLSKLEGHSQSENRVAKGHAGRHQDGVVNFLARPSVQAETPLNSFQFPDGKLCLQENDRQVIRFML